MSSESSFDDNIGLIPILHEDALNLEKRTAKNAKEDRGNYLVQAYRELV
ncbi:MAG: hypothetical protein V7L20_03395 [Nostoc sp.]